MIDLRQMRYFVAVAETLHFGRAAERLHVSQPPLSRQIAALERELGATLFERHSRQVRLTPAGQRFLEDARSVLAAFDEACRSARLVEQGELGELHVGFMMHAALSSVPPLTREFVSRHPHVRLHLREVLPSALVDAVLKGELDAGIGFLPVARKGIERRPVHREPLCLALPSAHALAGDDGPVAATALAGEALIAVPADIVPTLRQATDRWFADAGVTPTVRLEVQLQHSIVSLVAESLGVALVPASLRRLGLPGVVFRELADAPQVEQWLFWRTLNRNAALHALLDVVARQD